MKVGGGLKLEGMLGCCANGNVKNACVSDTEMGIAGTCQWRFCALSPKATVAVLLEIVAQVRISMNFSLSILFYYRYLLVSFLKNMKY